VTICGPAGNRLFGNSCDAPFIVGFSSGLFLFWTPEVIEANEQAEIEDADPPLDEEDLEENDLTVEEADQIVWDPPKKGSSGSEEKDITD